MLSKLVIGLLVIIFIIIGILGYYYVYLPSAQREALSKIKVYIRDVSVKSIKPKSVVLNVKLELENPTDIGITISKVEYTLYGNDHFLGNGSITSKIDIPALASKIVSSDFELMYSGAIKIVWDSLIKGEPINWRVKGIIYMSTNIGIVTVPFNATITR